MRGTREGMTARRSSTRAGGSCTVLAAMAGGSPIRVVTSTPSPLARAWRVGRRAECLRCCSSLRTTSTEMPARSATCSWVRPDSRRSLASRSPRCMLSLVVAVAKARAVHDVGIGQATIAAAPPDPVRRPPGGLGDGGRGQRRASPLAGEPCLRLGPDGPGLGFLGQEPYGGGGGGFFHALLREGRLSLKAEAERDQAIERDTAHLDRRRCRRRGCRGGHVQFVVPCLTL
jgi:hypothetical protein